MIRTRTIIDLFQNVVKNNEQSLCIVSPNFKCTYKELNDLANALAKKIQTQITNIQTPILVFCDSPKTVTCAVLGVMKSRNIYVPVLPKTPINRIKEIIKECNIKAYIATNRYSKIDLPYINLDSMEARDKTELLYQGKKNDIAYIIYTSGTTGKSKGVMIQHKGLVNAVLSRNEILYLTKNSHSIMFMGLAFDGFFTALFSPLISGATLYFPDDKFDIKSLNDVFKSNNISTFLCTPTMYSTLLELCDPILFKTVKLVSLAGESINRNLIQKSVSKFPHLVIANEYGPSENSICTSICKDVRSQKVITAGKIIKNVQAMIINEEKICEQNKVGELYLTGQGLALGYVNDKALTKSKFIEIDGSIWYKTGDLAYFNANEELIIVGREDSQIKINGYRVDLLEIQNALLTFDGIRNCIVIYDKAEGLLVYYISHGKINITQLDNYLKEKLSFYMLPSKYFQISSIPMVENGKIDLLNLKKFIITPDNEKILTKADKSLIRQVCNVFKSTLKVKKCNENDSFFSLGGNSLSGIILCDKLNEIFNLDIELDVLRRYPTPKLFVVSYLENERNNLCKSIIPFNRYWFVDCYFTSILALFEKAGRPLAPFIRCFEVESVKFNNTYQLLYKNKKALPEIFLEFGMAFDAGILENDFTEKILKHMKNKQPVMLHVDCFYLPYCKEKYKKEHFEHVIALINYDEKDEIFDVIDQENLDSISFCYHKLSLKNAQTSAYAEIINRKTFDNVDFVSIYPIYKNYIKRGKDKLDKSQLPFVIKSTIEFLEKNEIDILLVLKNLINYFQIEKEVLKYEKNSEGLLSLNTKESKLKRGLIDVIKNGETFLNKQNLIELLKQWL